MNREIKNIVDKVLNEELYVRTNSVKRRLFENKEMCEECGGNMSEGECMECGSMREGDIQELGGMDDGHPLFGDLNFSNMDPERRKKINKYLGIEDEYSDYEEDDDDDDDDDFKFNAPSPDYDYEEEDEDDLRIPDDMPSYKTKYRYSDEDKSGLDEAKKLSKGQKYIAKQAKPYDKIDGEDFKKLRSKKKEVKEKLYGRQKSIDKNKNNKIDAEDFEILRKKKGKVDESYYSVVLDNRKFLFTENEMIDIIENIINEEKKKTSGLKKGRVSASNVLKSSLNKSGKEENDYIESVTKKMKEYLKGASKGNYETNPSNFPEGNYDLDKRKGKIKKYTPSEAVDEYIEAYSYPGNTNLVFDEIKPDDEKIEKYLKGHKTTGNAEIDEDGKPYGNVVPSKTGEKFYDNYKNNYYGQEQMNASYKRYPQDTIEVAGDVTKKGKIKKGGKIAQSILDKVSESVENKKVISEIDKMKSLIGYNQKTQ